MNRATAGGLGVTPYDWGARVGQPDLSSERQWRTALLRHWTGTSPSMDQPLLDHHYIVQHLGGAKSVDRRFDGAPVSRIVESGSITLVPAGTQFKWFTRGPIEFAHLYISPAQFDALALKFGRAGNVALTDRVGCHDPLLETLYASMLAELRRPERPEILYLDSLLETFLLRLVLRYSNARVRLPKNRETLGAYQLRRVTEYLESSLDQPLTLADLAASAGGSVFHFVRAFKNAVGITPYSYLLRRRTERAKVLLDQSDQSIAAIARSCGFRSTSSFAAAFKRFVGTTPYRYRRRQ